MPRMFFMIYLCLLFGILASAGLVSSVNFEGISGSTVYTEFRVYYPDSHLKGRAINLRGDNCNLTWSRGVLLEHSGPNEWSTALLCPQGLSVSVKALANDSWMMGGNVVFRGGSKIVEIFPSFNPQVNSILEKTKVHSTILGNSRTVGLYLPPSFYDNALKQYEVLFMQDGQNLFQDAQAAFGTAWHVQNTLNTLIGEGAIRQIILVGIWNTPDRINQYTYSSDSEYGGGKADKYLDFLEKEVIPLLKNSWLQGRTLGKWGIGGSSLGGLLSCYAAYTRPSLFTTAICMSSSFWWNEEDFDKKILQKGQFKGGVQFYLDSGDSGTSKDGKDETLSVYRHFQRMGYVQGQNLFYYLDKGGQHSEYFWGKRFKVPLTDLYS